MSEIINRVYQYRPGGPWLKRNVDGIRRIVIHHSAYPQNNQSNDDRLRTMMGWHVNTNKWPGLSYHFAILRDGTIYKLNDESDLTWTDSHNQTSLAILVDGYFHPPKNEQPSTEQLASLEYLVARLRRELPQIQEVVGHRDISRIFDQPSWYSSCPGDHLYPYVGKLNANESITPQITQSVTQPIMPDLAARVTQTFQKFSNRTPALPLDDGNNFGQLRGLFNSGQTDEMVNLMLSTIADQQAKIKELESTPKAGESFSINKYLIGLSKDGTFTAAAGTVITGLVSLAASRIPELSPLQEQITLLLLTATGLATTSKAINNAKN